MKYSILEHTCVLGFKLLMATKELIGELANGAKTFALLLVE
jgi:hypothetical protein